MKVIYKYKVPNSTEFLLELSKGFVILDVQLQEYSTFTSNKKYDVSMWVMLDTEAEKRTVMFHHFMTGENIHKNMDYFLHVKTYQLGDTGLVFHLFQSIL